MSEQIKRMKIDLDNAVANAEAIWDALKPIKKHDAEATDGPWTFRHCPPYWLLHGPNEQWICDWDARGRSQEPNAEDRVFIAKARTDVPRLYRALDLCVETLSSIAQHSVWDDDIEAAATLRKIREILDDNNPGT